MPDFGDIDPDTGRTNARTEWSGSVDPLAPSVANGQISPAQWAEYQARRRRDAILGSLGLAGASIGLGAAGQLFGGAGGGALASGGGATLPAAATEGMLPMSMAGGVGGGGAGAAGMFAGMSPRDWAALGLSGASAVGGAISGNNNDTTPTSETQDPQMKALLELMMQRMRKSEPNFDSAQAMAQGLLPTQYQRGGGGMG